MKLTQRRIEAIECPPGKKDALIFDDEQAGLGVRVTAGGGKSFLVQYRLVGGKKQRMSLGSCSAVSLADARSAARAIMGEVAKGSDPAGDRRRKAAKDSLTLAALIDQWETLKLLPEKRPRYAAEAVRALRRAFDKHLPSAAEDLDRTAVVRVLDKFAKQGRSAMASRTAAYGSACYRWAAKRGSLTENPFQHLPLVSVVERERVLTDEELRAVWKATAGPGAFNGIVRTLMLTGQRREEVAGMTWGELSDDLATWTIAASRAKNGVEHIVPLSTEARAVIEAAPRREDDEGPGFVFRGQRGTFNGFSKSKADLDESSGVADWRLHDLRRSLATGLQRLGVRLEVTEAVLNHVSGSKAGIVRVYQRHTWSAEKRAALDAWGAHVAALVAGREAESNVTPIRARAGAV